MVKEDLKGVCQKIRDWKAKNLKIVAVSGGFDPIHLGHIALFEDAKKLGDKLIVIINSDKWLIRKKGYCNNGYHYREKFVKAIRYVDNTYLLESNRDDVSEALKLLKPHIFCNGGDRRKDNIPELNLCKKLRIKTVFGVGGSFKMDSSRNYKKKVKK